ncbi:MAG: hypothetical protein HQ481_07420 [Alphaproteobacteria bacterium]|nr:hypothetical protein [Alphaproteobacteria bacterium]
MTRVPATCLLLMLLCVLPATGRAGASSAAYATLAQEIWRAAGSATSVAVRPVDPDETGLPEPVVRALDDELTAALLATAPAGRRVVTRRDLPAVWDEALSFHGTGSRALLRSVAAEVLVAPRATPTRGGVALSAVLVAVAGDETGRALAVLGPVAIPLTVEALIATTPAVAARRAGVALAEHVRLTVDPGATVAARLRRSGERSPLADWFLDQVADHLIRRLAARPLGVSRPLRHMDDAPVALDLTLEGEVWDLGDRADVHLRVASSRGEARAMARMAMTTVPARFLPLTRDGGRVGAGMHRAEGTAEAGRGLRRDELDAAALTLARARLVTDALDQHDAPEATVVDREGVAAALRILEHGLPHEERWRVDAATGDRRHGALRARVIRLGGGGAPLVEATLDRQVYRPGEPLRVRARVGGGRVYLALYVWQADGTVVRVAPTGHQARTLAAATQFDWPGPGDAEVTVAPMPGVSRSLEAVIVVASAVPFDADRPAPVLGTTAEDSLAAAGDGAAFLDRLAALDTARMTLAVLPYQVQAAP